MKQVGIWMMAGAMLVLAACSSSTKVTSSWKNQDAGALQPQSKVLVMALVPQKEGALRSSMEQEMVLALKQKGVNAVSSVQEYGPQAFRNTNEKAALKQIRQRDIDQVMTIVMLDKAREKQYVPGRVAYAPFSPYYGRFWGYYNWRFNNIYEPGYYTTNTRYFLESNLYDMRDRKMVYSAQSESFDPPSAARLAVVYSQKVVKDMVKQQLLSSNK
ncbi:hypothetical protein MKQ68_22155 [Chitinophaga horti]|uniref:DUF4136 domain-containing protein n=1 Tax=Chitinophaga horti TaxID=2920382 RepID=A0ABY6IZH0_9BACT|nr:hypothetical protein [Chitinophaga horti]UYQ92787.1 hypothetical protein MKQ68_22155 [Chitinophaga horti]